VAVGPATTLIVIVGADTFRMGAACARLLGREVGFLQGSEVVGRHFANSLETFFGFTPFAWRESAVPLSPRRAFSLHPNRKRKIKAAWNSKRPSAIPHERNAWGGLFAWLPRILGLYAHTHKKYVRPPDTVLEF
jgi:hypothetical protein